MNAASVLDVQVEDFLKDNRHLYARKAARKKISLIKVEATNKGGTVVCIEFGDAKLIAGDRTYSAERRDVVIRKLSEFTWDFLFYSIFDFQPVLAAADAFFFLTGPLYNRRLRKQLRLLVDGETALNPGESKSVVVAFRGVSQRPTRLQVSYRDADGSRSQIECEIR